MNTVTMDTINMTVFAANIVFRNGFSAIHVSTFPAPSKGGCPPTRGAGGTLTHTTAVVWKRTPWVSCTPGCTATSSYSTHCLLFSPPFKLTSPHTGATLFHCRTDLPCSCTPLQSPQYQYHCKYILSQVWLRMSMHSAFTQSICFKPVTIDGCLVLMAVILKWRALLKWWWSGTLGSNTCTQPCQLHHHTAPHRGGTQHGSQPKHYN